MVAIGPTAAAAGQSAPRLVRVTPDRPLHCQGTRADSHAAQDEYAGRTAPRALCPSPPCPVPAPCVCAQVCALHRRPPANTQDPRAVVRPVAVCAAATTSWRPRCNGDYYVAFAEGRLPKTKGCERLLLRAWDAVVHEAPTYAAAHSADLSATTPSSSPDAGRRTSVTRRPSLLGVPPFPPMTPSAEVEAAVADAAGAAGSLPTAPSPDALPFTPTTPTMPTLTPPGPFMLPALAMPVCADAARSAATRPATLTATIPGTAATIPGTAATIPGTAATMVSHEIEFVAVLTTPESPRFQVLRAPKHDVLRPRALHIDGKREKSTNANRAGAPLTPSGELASPHEVALVGGEAAAEDAQAAMVAADAECGQSESSRPGETSPSTCPLTELDRAYADLALGLSSRVPASPMVSLR